MYQNSENAQFEQIKNLINSNPIFRFVEIKEENKRLGKIEMTLPPEMKNELTYKFGIDVDSLTNNHLIEQLVSNIQKEAISFYLNNFKEKDDLFKKHLEHINGGILIVPSSTATIIQDENDFILDNEKVKTLRGGFCYSIGKLKDTEITINPFFSWNDKRFIYLSDKILVTFDKFEMSKILVEPKEEDEDSETLTKHCIKIQYSLRFPLSFLGFLKEEEK